VHIHFGMAGVWSTFDSNLEVVPPTTATTRCVYEKCVFISAKCMYLCVYMISRLCQPRLQQHKVCVSMCVHIYAEYLYACVYIISRLCRSRLRPLSVYVRNVYIYLPNVCIYVCIWSQDCVAHDCDNTMRVCQCVYIYTQNVCVFVCICAAHDCDHPVCMWEMCTYICQMYAFMCVYDLEIVSRDCDNTKCVCECAYRYTPNICMCVCKWSRVVSPTTATDRCVCVYV